MTDLTRKLCYHKDDRAMRPIYRCRENFAQSLTIRPLGMLISFFSKNRLLFWKNRFFFRLSNLGVATSLCHNVCNAM